MHIIDIAVDTLRQIICSFFRILCRPVTMRSTLYKTHANRLRSDITSDTIIPSYGAVNANKELPTIKSLKGPRLKYNLRYILRSEFRICHFFVAICLRDTFTLSERKQIVVFWSKDFSGLL